MLQNACVGFPVGALGMAFTVTVGVPLLLVPIHPPVLVTDTKEYVLVELGLTGMFVPEV